MRITDSGLYLTQLALPSHWAFTFEGSSHIDACSVILTGERRTLVNLLLTELSTETRVAQAIETIDAVDATLNRVCYE